MVELLRRVIARCLPANQDLSGPKGRLAMRSLVLLLSMVALMIGCSRTDDPVSADTSSELLAQLGPSGRAFYPLDIGNRWIYESTVTITTAMNGEPVGEPQVITSQHVVEQICRESRDGRVYTIEEERTIRGGEEIRRDWVRYRQDAEGLFTANVAATTPPECEGVSALEGHPSGNDENMTSMRGTAAAHVLAEQVERGLYTGRIPFLAGDGTGEITQLRYPLHPGQEWVPNEDVFSIQYRVEAVEVIDLPTGRTPAYRIRRSFPGYPNDDYLHWYSRCGFLRSSAHSEAPIVGEDGEIVGTLLVDVVFEVQSMDLNGAQPCSVDRE
jgi:hypothetical protein